MRVAVVAEYYPRRRDPVLGVWAHRQAIAARNAGADVRVLVLERPVPPAAAARAAARGRPGRMAGWVAAAARQPRIDDLDGIPVEYVRFAAPSRERSYGRWDAWAERPLRRALRRTARRHGVDVVHAHYALPAGRAALPWCREQRVPLCVSVHTGEVFLEPERSPGGPWLAPGARQRAAEALRSSAQVLCNSAATLRRAAALAGGDERMRVVHLGAEPPDPIPPRHSDPTLVTLGHAIERKRHADVLFALDLLRDRAPELRWSVIGDGPELPGLRAEVARRGLGDRVSFHGQLPPDDALAELARCHLMAMPSRHEAFGVAYVEALACGVPAIGLQGEDGPEEIAALGPGMLLVPERNPAALAETIAGLVADDAGLVALAEDARRTAREHFSWERCGRDTVAAYEAALETGAS